MLDLSQVTPFPTTYIYNHIDEHKSVQCTSLWQGAEFLKAIFKGRTMFPLVREFFLCSDIHKYIYI